MNSPSHNGKALSAKAASRQEERHRLVTDAVMAAGSMAIEDLARMFDVSVMTIHRDLDRLEAQNVLRKSRGMATALPSSTVVESSSMTVWPGWMKSIAAEASSRFSARCCARR